MEQNTNSVTHFRWQPEDTFTLSGNDFGTLYNTIMNIIQHPNFQDKLVEARDTMGIVALSEIMKTKLKEGLDSGVVKEVSDETLRQEAEAFNNTPADAVTDSQVKGN